MVSRPPVSPEVSWEGLLLGPWLADDVPGVCELADDPATRAWSPSLRKVQTLADARRWVEERHSPDRLDWAVREPTTRRLIGRVGLFRFDDRPASAEIGYGTHPAHRRQGVARRAVQAVVGYGVEQLALERISLVHATGNFASCAVAAACGFTFEGVERSALDHGDGVRHDMHRHARLATDPAGTAERPAPPLEPVELTTDGLRLRPWLETDAEVVLAALRDPLVVRWNPRLPLRDLDQARTWLTTRSARWRAGEAASWAVVEGERVVGSMTLRELNRGDAFAVASYWTVPSARGRGIAVRSLARATAYAFEVLGLHRVQLAHAVENNASCRVAEKAGLRLEGTLRGSNRLVDGFVDEHLHARLVTD